MNETPAAPTRDDDIVAQYQADLLSGAVFYRAAHGYASEIGYRPPINRRAWSDCMSEVAAMGKVSDPLAQVAVAIIGRVNLYGTPGQACSAVYQYAGEALARGYDDVLRRASPEPGRYSDSQRDFTLSERVAIAHWLIDACRPFAGAVGTTISVGWCLDRIAKDTGYRHRDAGRGTR